MVGHRHQGEDHGVEDERRRADEYQDKRLERLDLAQRLGQRLAHHGHRENDTKDGHLEIGESSRWLPAVQPSSQLRWRHLDPDPDQHLEEGSIGADPATEEAACPDDHGHDDRDPQHENQRLGQEDLAGEFEPPVALHL
jgi:hypothetical protein